MKTSMYFSYTWRSLRRGGHRTILAVFCVAVGVMAVVALQQVGFMMQNSLSGNAREANGGDIVVMAQGAPMKASDLAFFDKLKEAGTITGYSAIASANGGLNNASTSIQTFTLEAVDPEHFPLVSAPALVEPASDKLAQLLTHNQVIVTQNFLKTYNKQFGDSFSLYIKTFASTGQILKVKIAGVIANTGLFAQAGNLMLISLPDYQASAPATPVSYTVVDVTTADEAHIDPAVKAITGQFPLVSLQTAPDVLKAAQSSIDLLNKFLEIAGLIALLIGGVGILNTMQVVLSRRKTEIAMLKTAGYRRIDLYMLFGLETGLLGLVGGIIGVVGAIGVSYLIQTLLQSLGSNVSFGLNPGLLLGGVVVGGVTALIFGLLPIVQAANIRPLQVLREVESKSWSGRVLTVLLLGLFSILFCALAIVILNGDVTLGIEITYGMFIFLLVLSGIFSLIVLVVSKLPVPERLNLRQIALVVIGVAVSELIYQVLPVFGLMALAVSLFGLVVVFLPRNWKVNVKMALRNLGRRRSRTTTTLLALFIGIWGIGIVIGIGQDLGHQIKSALEQNSPYNLVATTLGQDSSTLGTRLNTLPGLTASREDPFVTALPVAINGYPAQQALPGGDLRQQDLNLLGGIEGYDLAHTIPAQKIIEGRNLAASDNGTDNVLVSQIMTSRGWAGMNLKPGDTVTFASPDSKTQKTVTIVGIISVPTSFETLGKVLAPASLVNALNSGTAGNTKVFYMKVAPSQVNEALNQLEQIVPNASVQNLSDAAVSFLQQVNSIMDVVLAISALSMVAGIIIIANSIALAMLERRRELGILKSVGYTSRTILSQVLIENGIVGVVGAFIATLLAAGGVTLGSKAFFNNNLTLNMEPVVTISLVTGPVLLALLTAVLVAGKAVVVRPLTVLKYE